MSTEGKETPLVGITDVAGLGKLADSQLVNKAYDDLLANAAKQFGEGLEDVASGLRLFAAPFMVMAAWHKRLKRYCHDVLSRVPEERRVEPAPEVAGSVFQSLVFMSEDNPLKEMYLRLLSRAIDRDRQGEAHPAFARLIDQLSPDEAVILFSVKKVLSQMGVRTRLDLRVEEDDEMLYRASERPLLLSTWAHTDKKLLNLETSIELAHPRLAGTYIRHLRSLGLLPVDAHEDMATYDFWETDFSYLFMTACVPD